VPGALSVRRRLSLIGVATVLLLIIVLSGAGYAGYQAGLTQRDTQFRETQAADLALQYDLGLEDLAAGRYEVAAARFEYIVQLDPNFRDANQQLANARAGLTATATPRPVSTLTPTAPAEVTAAPTSNGEAETIYALAQDAYATSNWDEVIKQLTLLHAVDATYEEVRVDGMLYVALRNRGIARILGDELEAGMFDLDQAEAFGPLDTDALNHRAWARLYLAALSYWGLDWRQAMEILEQLYLIAPYFHDTNVRLYRSTVNYADQLLRADEYCAAAERYQAARLLFVDDAEVDASLAEAEAACAQTPTPDPLATGDGSQPEASETPQP
jgi:tetratricopeptide (TPR) repeat protein